MAPKRKTKACPTDTDGKRQKPDGNNQAMKDKLEKLYGIQMPEDFVDFWKFCEMCNVKDPLNALSALDLRLVGPFYYMNAPEPKSSKPPQHYHIQWRYYYDTPEFLTVITTDQPNTNLFHIGYFRDDPKTLDTSIVVSNGGKDAKLSVLGDNLFAALSITIKEALKKAQGVTKDSIMILKRKLEEYIKKETFSLDAKSALVKARDKKIVTKSFHGAGIVVPIVDDVGYRPLHHNDVQLKRFLKKIVDAKDDDDRMAAFEPIQEMVNFIQFANDECDYGMGLELGIDLFCYGSRYFHKMSNMLLSTGYKLLKYDLYADICEAHLADRRKENFARMPDGT